MGIKFILWGVGGVTFPKMCTGRRDEEFRFLRGWGIDKGGGGSSIFDVKNLFFRLEMGNRFMSVGPCFGLLKVLQVLQG